VAFSGRIIPVDVGMRNIATTIENGETKFYGAGINAIRRRYMEQKEDGKSQVPAEFWRPEDRKEVRRQARAVARVIVEKAVKDRAVIALGKPSRSYFEAQWNYAYWPVQSFVQHLRSRARALGVRVLNVPEAETSQTCSQCGSHGKRLGAVFVCYACQIALNSDMNAAKNIAKRAESMLNFGAF